jgi:hypothetical protein
MRSDLAVAVHITSREQIGAARCRNDNARCELPVALAHVDRDGVGIVVRRREIDVTIAIEVGRNHRRVVVPAA